MPDEKVRQLVIPAHMWEPVVKWLERHGYVAALMPMIEDDLETYVIQPGPELFAKLLKMSQLPER